MKNHRQKTDYKGVYFTHGIDPATGKPEMIYHIRYRTKNDDGSSTEHTETAGRQHRDNMTPAKANIIRARRMHGDEKPNKIRRDELTAAKSKKIWTISSLWVAYKEANLNLKGIIVYEATFNTHLSRAFGKKKPETITPFDIDRLKLKQMAGKSDKTISNALELLRRIVNFGVNRGLCTGPGFTIQLPRVHNPFFKRPHSDLSQALASSLSIS